MLASANGVGKHWRWFWSQILEVAIAPDDQPASFVEKKVQTLNAPNTEKMETNSQHENLPGTPKGSARGLYSAAEAKSRKRMGGAGGLTNELRRRNQ